MLQVTDIWFSNSVLDNIHFYMMLYDTKSSHHYLFSGIFVFIALMITFYHANSVITREVSRHARRNVWPLIAVLVNLLACIVFIHFVFEDAKLYLL